jgi:hypothetical protein
VTTWYLQCHVIGVKHAINCTATSSSTCGSLGTKHRINRPTTRSHILPLGLAPRDRCCSCRWSVIALDDVLAFDLLLLLLLPTPPPPPPPPPPLAVVDDGVANRSVLSCSEPANRRHSNCSMIDTTRNCCIVVKPLLSARCSISSNAFRCLASRLNVIVDACRVGACCV